MIEETPDLSPEKMTIGIDEINRLLGLELEQKEIIQSLERMGYGAKLGKSKHIQIQIPRYRMDILHAVDIIEDIAIGYGFDHIKPSMPHTMTTGKISTITGLKNKVRDIMIGMGYLETMNYIMTSPEILGERMNRKNPMVSTSNPKSRNYSVLRNSLLPVLLNFAAQNQHSDYPQKIFEVGDIVIPNEERETMVDQIPSICGLSIDVKVNITDLMTEIGFLLRNLGLDTQFGFKSVKNGDYIDGRSANILVNGNVCGTFGEIAPEILSNFELGYPAIAFEIFLPRNGVWAR